MYTRILVPLDGSKLAEGVLPYARLLGKGLGSRIELLRVIEPLPVVSLTDPAREAHRQKSIAGLTAEAEKYLKDTVTSLQTAELTASKTIRHGDPSAETVEESEVEPATLIAMSTHGRSGLARWAWGSVTDKVLHGSCKPLLIVRSREENGEAPPVRLETIIVPLDESPLAEQVLPYVADLAKKLGLKVILLQATPHPGDYYRYMEYPPVGLENMARDVDSAAADYLLETKNKLLGQGVTSVEERLLHGHPAAAIVDLAQKTPGSLVAMTTHGRSGVGRWVMGSVADRVIRHSGGPVLLIRARE